MTWIEVIWTAEPDGNIRHMADHRVTPDEVEHVLANPMERDASGSSGRPIVFGHTTAGRFLAVVYEQIDDITVYPITAFDIED
ncbi:MAG: hypothetical protein GY715_12350 [Planctomycetes bacterium]|nr:hypothetical protein [Planctomycetota bacterium]